MSNKFYEIEPSLINYWRGVILFGLNTASYKFALGKSLLEFASAEPRAMDHYKFRVICNWLKIAEVIMICGFLTFPNDSNLCS